MRLVNIQLGNFTCKYDRIVICCTVYLFRFDPSLHIILISIEISI